MRSLLLVSLRKSLPAVFFLPFAAVLTGCGPERGEQILPYTHSASLGSNGQLISDLPSDLRRHPHSVRVAQPRRHSAHL